MVNLSYHQIIIVQKDVKTCLWKPLYYYIILPWFFELLCSLLSNNNNKTKTGKTMTNQDVGLQLMRMGKKTSWGVSALNK